MIINNNYTITDYLEVIFRTSFCVKTKQKKLFVLKFGGQFRLFFIGHPTVEIFVMFYT